MAKPYKPHLPEGAVIPRASSRTNARYRYPAAVRLDLGESAVATVYLTDAANKTRTDGAARLAGVFVNAKALFEAVEQAVHDLPSIAQDAPQLVQLFEASKDYAYLTEKHENRP